MSGSRRRVISWARSSPIAAVGWSSNTTTRTCCTSVSIANGNSTAQCSCAPWARRPTRGNSACAFYKCNDIVIKDKKLFWKVSEGLIGHKLSHAISAKGGDTVVPQGRKITNSVFKELQKSKIEQVEVSANDLEGAYVAADVIDMETGEVLIEANHEITAVIISAG